MMNRCKIYFADIYTEPRNDRDTMQKELSRTEFQGKTTEHIEQKSKHLRPIFFRFFKGSIAAHILYEHKSYHCKQFRKAP